MHLISHAGGRRDIRAAGAGEGQILCAHPRRPGPAEGRTPGSPGSRRAEPSPSHGPAPPLLRVWTGWHWLDSSERRGSLPRHRSSEPRVLLERPPPPSDTRPRPAGRRAHPPPPTVPSAHAGARIIAWPVGFPDRGFLIGLGGSSPALLGIKLNIWTLSLSLSPPLSPAKTLRQTRKPATLTSPGTGEGGKPKVAAAPRSPRGSRFSSGIPGAAVGPRRADIKNCGLWQRRRPASEERSPGYSGAGGGEGAFLPTLPGAR